MVTALIDTSVVIDLLRGHSPAQAWYREQDNLGISRVVMLEAIQGATDRQHEIATLRLSQRFEVVEAVTSDLIWATDAQLRYHLSHNVDAFDCLIASVSYRLQLPPTRET